jgi:hypothetical protein
MHAMMYRPCLAGDQDFIRAEDLRIAANMTGQSASPKRLMIAELSAVTAILLLSPLALWWLSSLCDDETQTPTNPGSLHG